LEKNFDTVFILLKFYLKPVNAIFETTGKYDTLDEDK